MESDIGVGGRFIEEVVGLDKDQWSVLAITLLPATRRSDEDGVLVYALRKSDIPQTEGVHPNDALKAFAREHGGVPVTKFRVSAIDIRDVLHEAKTAIIQLRPSGIRGVELHITGESETSPFG